MKKSEGLWIFLWLSVAIGGRLVPHVPNATPLFALALLGARWRSPLMITILTLVSLIASDGLLAYLQGGEWMGPWSFFVYSGFLGAVVWGHYFLRGERPVYYCLLQGSVATLIYWIWTNFGCWLVGGLYPHDLAGLTSCYVLALPFLANQLMGVWISLTALLWAEQRGVLPGVVDIKA